MTWRLLGAGLAVSVAAVIYGIRKLLWSFEQVRRVGA